MRTLLTRRICQNEDLKSAVVVGLPLWLTVLTGISDPELLGFHSLHMVMCVPTHERPRFDSGGRDGEEDAVGFAKKKNPKYHACPKYLAALCCGSAFRLSIPPGFWKGGVETGNVGVSTAYWFSILKISRMIHTIDCILRFLNLICEFKDGISICAFSSCNCICLEGVFEVDEDLEDELDKPGTTIGTKFPVLQVIRIPFLMRCGFWPLIILRISVFIEKLSERQYCWRVFEDFQSQEYVQFFDIHNCLFMRLHFSIGCYDYRRTTRLRQSIHFSRIQVLFAGHVHRRSGVDNKFSFLRFKS